MPDNVLSGCGRIQDSVNMRLVPNCCIPGISSSDFFPTDKKDTPGRPQQKQSTTRITSYDKNIDHARYIPMHNSSLPRVTCGCNQVFASYRLKVPVILIDVKAAIVMPAHTHPVMTTSTQ